MSERNAVQFGIDSSETFLILDIARGIRVENECSGEGNEVNETIDSQRYWNGNGIQTGKECKKYIELTLVDGMHAILEVLRTNMAVPEYVLRQVPVVPCICAWTSGVGIRDCYCSCLPVFPVIMLGATTISPCPGLASSHAARMLPLRMR